MSRTYKFLNPEGAYFVSFAVVVPIAIGRMDIFTRNEYKDILLESVNYNRQKGLLKGVIVVNLQNHAKGFAR